MDRTKHEILAARKAVKQKYQGLFTQVEAILFSHDPMGIAFFDDSLVGTNSDEYAPEVETILPRLHTTQSADDVTNIVYEEFSRWFGKDNIDDEQDFTPIAQEIFQAWTNHQTNNQT